MSKLSPRDYLEGFFKEPSKENLFEIIGSDYGETNNFDFKREWIRYDVIAKHIIAIANSGGGCIIFGVEEDGETGEFKTIGLEEKLKDKAEVVGSLKKFIPSNLIDTLEVLDFRYDNDIYSEKIKGKSFQGIFIPSDAKELPYVCLNDSGDLVKGEIYIRRGTSSEKASYDDIQKLIGKRIKAEAHVIGEIKLDNELGQLKILYNHIDKFNYEEGNIALFAQIFSKLATLGDKKKVPNEKYPEEDFEDFVVRMIDKKKDKIERLI